MIHEMRGPRTGRPDRGPDAGRDRGSSYALRGGRSAVRSRVAVPIPLSVCLARVAARRAANEYSHHRIVARSLELRAPFERLGCHEMGTMATSGATLAPCVSDLRHDARRPAARCAAGGPRAPMPLPNATARHMDGPVRMHKPS